MVFRRFGYFQNRLLLEKQGELMTLETRIDELDECLNQAQPSQLRTVQMVQDSILPGARDVVAERQQLLERADQVFREYGTFINVLNIPSCFRTCRTFTIRSKELHAISFRLG